MAQCDLVNWLVADPGLAVMDAYQLISQAVESPLANVCDTNYTSLAKIRKEWLPPRHGPLAFPARRHGSAGPCLAAA